MDAGTEAIVRLAWSRRLGLADDALLECGPGRSSTTSDGVLMGVVLAGSTVATGPESLLPAMSELSDEQLTDGSTLLSLTGGRGRLLGEATLMFTDTYISDSSWTSVEVDDDPMSVVQLEQVCPPDDVLEVELAGLDWRFAVRDDADVPVCGAGFAEWEQILAHLGVLTAPSARRQGWATRAAAVATNEALDRGLIPQWRARTGNTASLALAEKLGYLPLGRQTTVLLS
jgi:GNAT superfamily N-acetyltransferase